MSVWTVGPDQGAGWNCGQMHISLTDLRQLGTRQLDVKFRPTSRGMMLSVEPPRHSARSPYDSPFARALSIGRTEGPAHFALAPPSDPRSRQGSLSGARRSASMISARKIRALFRISADNPELVQAQFRILTMQLPLLYLILLTNVLAVVYTHFATAPRSLILYGSGPLGLVCLAGTFHWMWNRDRELSTDKIVRRLKLTVIMTCVITLLFLLSGLALYPYGDAYDQAQIAYFLGITAIVCFFCLLHLPPAALILFFLGVLPGDLFFILSGRPTLVAMGVNMTVVAVAIVRILFTHSRDFASMINFQKELAKNQLKTLRLAEENFRLANLDVLTDLPNRRQFFANLNEMLRLAVRDGKRFVVGVLDLDGFKSVNDIYGHVIGDQVLVETGRRLKDISDDARIARASGRRRIRHPHRRRPFRRANQRIRRAHLRGP